MRPMKASSSVGLGSAVASDARLQGLGRVEGDHLAPVDERHPVAVLGLVHEVGGDHHGHAAGHDRVDEPPELAPRQRIDARGRLVEEQHRRVVHDGAGERQPLLEAERQLPGGGGEVRPQVEGGGHALDRLAAPCPRQSVGAGEELQVLAHGEIAVERELLRHVAKPRPAGGRGLVEVEPVDARGALAGAEQAAHHLEGGGLAGAVRPQEAEDLAPRDGEGNAVRGREAAEAAGEAPCVYWRRAFALGRTRARLHRERPLRLAAEQRHEGVLEARRGGGRLQALGGLKIGAPSAAARPRRRRGGSPRPA